MRYGLQRQLESLGESVIPYDVAIEVHQHIQNIITPHQEVVDVWRDDIPEFGDCDDYVLSKRRILLDKGYSHLDMAILVVGELSDHLILAVNTDMGWIILDNLHPPYLYTGNLGVKGLYNRKWRNNTNRGLSSFGTTGPYSWYKYCEKKNEDFKNGKPSSWDDDCQ